MQLKTEAWHGSRVDITDFDITDDIVALAANVHDLQDLINSISDQENEEYADRGHQPSTDILIDQQIAENFQ